MTKIQLVNKAVLLDNLTSTLSYISLIYIAFYIVQNMDCLGYRVIFHSKNDRKALVIIRTMKYSVLSPTIGLAYPLNNIEA